VVHIGPSGIVGAAHAAVGASVSPARPAMPAWPSSARGECQRIFLIRTAPPFAAHRDSQLAARQDDGTTALCLEVEGYSSMLAATVRASPSSAVPSTTQS